MVEVSELKPCPFCGGPATDQLEDNGSGVVWVICDNVKGGCGCEGPYKHSPEDAIAAWNRRALSVPAPSGGGVEPVALIERAVLPELRKHYSATGTVCSPLFKDKFGDKVPLYTTPTKPDEDRMRERVAELEKALEPFAKIFDLAPNRLQDDSDVLYETTSFARGSASITLGDLRRARAVLANTSEAP